MVYRCVRSAAPALKDLRHSLGRHTGKKQVSHHHRSYEGKELAAVSSDGHWYFR